jgi:hypothetical protein
LARPVLLHLRRQVVHHVLGRRHQAGRHPDVVAERVDVGAQVGAVALEHLGRLVEDLLQLTDLLVDVLLLGGQALVDLLDVLAQRRALALGGDPEAAGAAQAGGEDDQGECLRCG